MPKLSYQAYFVNHFIFPLLWVFSGLWSWSLFSLSHTYTNLSHPLIGKTIFILAIVGISYSLSYFILYDLLGRIFKRSLGSLLILPSLLRAKRYYMGSFGNGGGPSYQSVSTKYTEWIKEDNIREEINISKRKIKIKRLVVLLISLLFFLAGFILL